MNSKKSKRRKGVKKGIKTKTKNGEAEVFVLPPDLLLKLGINLQSVGPFGNIQETPTVSTSKTVKLDLTHVIKSDNAQNSEKINAANEQPTIEKNKRDTSILETADLMKTSVFLSPTFLIDNKNIESRELEIANVLEAKNINDEVTSNTISEQIAVVQLLPQINKSTLECDMNMAGMNTMPEKVAVNKLDSQIDELVSTLDPHPDGSEIRKSINNLNHESDIEISNIPDTKFVSYSTQESNHVTASNNDVTDILEKPETAVSTHDYSDEAYLSDCSTSNSGPSDIADNPVNYIPEVNTCDNQNPLPKSLHNKVKIISEEIISPSKFKDLQIKLSPKRCDLIPVSMNCILTSNKFGENVQYDVNTEAQNARSFASQYENGSVHNGAKTDLVVLFDEKGNEISTVTSNMPVEMIDAQKDYANNFDINTDVKIEDLSPHSDQIEIKTDTKSIMQTPESSLGDLDLIVIDMEMEENEDILQSFVNEITSNDDNRILQKIEQSEKACLAMSNPDPRILQLNTTTESNLEWYQLENIPARIDDKDKREGFLTATNNDLAKTNFEFNFTDSSIQMTNMNDDQEEYIKSESYNYETELTHNIERNVKESLSMIDEQAQSLVQTFHTLKEKDNITNIVPVTKTITEETNCNLNRNNNRLCTDLFDVETKTVESFLKPSMLPKINDKVFHLASEEPKLIKENDTFVTNDKTVSEEKSKYELNYTNMHQSNEDSSDMNLNNTIESIKAPDDKVEEIALYLSQFVKNQTQPKKLRRKSKMKLETMQPTKQPTDPLTNKLCIEGVEKPGGWENPQKDNRRNKVFKTYTRATKSFKKSGSETKPSTFTTQREDVCVAVNEQDNDCIIVEKNTRNIEFCLCSDFGRLAYYDSQYAYEHIHFWEHKIIDCDSESIFSIYNDIPDINFNTCMKEVEEISEDRGQNSDTTVDNICWQSCKRVHEVDLIKETTFTQDHISETDHTISMNIVDTKDRLQQDVELEETASVAVSQESEFQLALNATNEKTFQSEATNRDNKVDELQNSNQKRSHGNADEILSHKEVTSENDNQIELSKCYLHTDNGNTAEEEAEEIIPINQQCSNVSTQMCRPETDEQKEKKKYKLSKSINQINYVEKHSTVVENKIPSSGDTLTFEKQNFDDSSNILETNKSKKVANLDSAVKLEAVDLVVQDTCTVDNTEVITRAKKRKKSVNHAEDDEEKLPSKKSIKCDVCKKLLMKSEWDNHVSTEHCFIAWKAGKSFDFENPRLLKKLQEKVKDNSKLKCTFCSAELIHPKKFLTHVQKCYAKFEESSTDETSSNEAVEDHQQPDTNTADQTIDDVTYGNKSVSSGDNVSQCGVCKEVVATNEWIEHIAQKHEYLAWKNGETPLNINNEDYVRIHLINLVREIGELTCSKCGLTRKYPKTYMQHIKNCTGRADNESAAVPVTPKVEKNLNNVDTDSTSTSDTMVKCGVCDKEVCSRKWINHIGREHNYMAWKEGDSLDVTNEVEVYNHLYDIVRKNGYLVCSKCGLTRKYVKTFLQHTKICDSETLMQDNEGDDEAEGSNRKLVCALCSEEVVSNKWKDHKMEKHYNVAWTVGSIPVDFKNQYVIDNLMKEYMDRYKKMVCNICNATRVSRIGFYAHIVACRKTEEELEIHRNICNICNKKYLCIYHNQHMAWHTQQEYTRERKLKAKEEEEQEVVKQETQGQETTPGRRRAAQKARNIIENFKNEQLAYKCPTCKFGCDSKEELANHACKGKNDGGLSDSGESAKLDNYSGEEDESDDSLEDDSNASDEEQADASKTRKKKKYPAYVQTQRFPYVPKSLTTFLSRTGAEFRQQHFTYEKLFPHLRGFNCEPVPADQLGEYLPPLEESCKVQFCDNNWKIYKRFEGEKKKSMNAKNIHVVPCQSIFTGGCIQCISWAPPESDDARKKDNFLAVACHHGADAPRLLVDDTASYAGLIQLWNFGTFEQVPELVFGLAHDYGTAWAMDWCPCGVRDELTKKTEAGKVLRLGLLAVAFSSGCVAVFSIPYPSTLVKREQVINKLKPVAELRLTMNPDRKIYQATSINWSLQKQYESLVVGYGDGTMAYYDLNTESPFLKTVEKDVVILYPYHDERLHNSCVTGVSLYPSVESVGPSGAACCASATGVALLARPGVRPARQHAAAAVAGAQFEPLWPCAALTGDDANVASAVNEIEWHGGGRRMGGGSAGAGCRFSGRFVFAASPLLRVRYPHPADNMARKQILGLVQMTPLTKKRKKLANDELQTKVEPITYDDAIRKYGIELRLDKESIEKTSKKPREFYPERNPERFPLADVTSMAFCPEEAHHRKLAIATHSGILFVLQV